MDTESRTLTSLGYQKLASGDIDGAVETLLRAVALNSAEPESMGMLSQSHVLFSGTLRVPVEIANWKVNQQ